MKLKLKLAEEAMFEAKEKWLSGFDQETSFINLGKLIYLGAFNEARGMALASLSPDDTYMQTFNKLLELGEEEVE